MVLKRCLRLLEPGSLQEAGQLVHHRLQSRRVCSIVRVRLEELPHERPPDQLFIVNAMVLRGERGSARVPVQVPPALDVMIVAHRAAEARCEEADVEARVVCPKSHPSIPGVSIACNRAELP